MAKVSKRNVGGHKLVPKNTKTVNSPIAGFKKTVLKCGGKKK